MPPRYYGVVMRIVFVSHLGWAGISLPRFLGKSTAAPRAAPGPILITYKANEILKSQVYFRNWRQFLSGMVVRERIESVIR